MDNNTAEQLMREPVVGRKNYYGSGSQWAGHLLEMMFSLFQTLKVNKINPHQCLRDYLSACAKNKGRPLESLEGFLPWSLPEKYRAD